MIQRVYVPLFYLVSGEEACRQVPISRRRAIRLAQANLAKRYGSVIFQASGKKNAAMRWLDFEVGAGIAGER